MALTTPAGASADRTAVVTTIGASQFSEAWRSFAQARPPLVFSLFALPPRVPVEARVVLEHVVFRAERFAEDGSSLFDDGRCRG
jgi:hypothetical protein